MNTALQTQPEEPLSLVPADVSAGALQSALAGDLSRLPETERLKFYGALCNTVGLNPLSKPFDWLTFQGKLTLYANKGCAEQLRKINQASVEIIERKVEFGCFIVRVAITDPSGRRDEALAALPFAEKNPDAVALAMMKCETKAKRRATLSFYGLSMLVERDEEAVTDKVATEIIPGVESAEDRANRLNASLTGGEKAEAITVEEVKPVEPAKPAEVKVEASKPEPVAAPVEAAQPVAEEPDPFAEPAPATPQVSEEDKFWRNVETVLAEHPKSAQFLVSRGSLAKGADIATMNKEFAMKILKQPQKFITAVAQWDTATNKGATK